MADALLELGDYDQAELKLKEGLEFSEKYYPNNEKRAYHSLGEYGRLLYFKSRDNQKIGKPLYYVDAEKFIQRALKVEQDNFGVNNETRTVNLHNLAVVYQKTGRQSESLEIMRRVFSILERRWGPHNPRIANGANDLAIDLQDAGELLEAEKMYLRAIQIRKRAFGPDDPSLIDSLIHLGDINAKQKNTEAAISLYEQARGLLKKKGWGVDSRISSLDEKVKALTK